MPSTSNVSSARRISSIAAARVAAEVLAQLDHPGIVGFVTAGEEQDHAVLVMELVDGVPLSRSLKSNPPTPAQAIDYARQVCEALVHAHGRGVVHRDVKASNLLLSRGLSGDRLVLIDFGLGLVEGGQRVSSSDVVLGSVHTMPPEQLAGETSDGRADVYSLASLLFRMLSGHYPFHASSSVQVLAMHAHAKVPELRERIDAPLTVPRDLPELVTRCLQKAPDARPDADTLLGALSALPAEGEGAWVTIQPDVPAPEGRTREEEPPVAITPLGVALGGLAVAVVVVALWWML